MYKLVKIYTHGAVEVTGTQIFVTAEFSMSKEADSLVALFVYNDRGVLENIYTPFNSQLSSSNEKGS